ncbi:MAG: hypothetical protein K2N56_10350 [Oscillospiraceae bacterium]|nr:hypothetical protein [Oscillospiraceae bacterium]
MEYNIPLKFKEGSFKFNELGGADGDILILGYDTEWQLLTYNAPMYGNEVRIYTVPRELMPNGLTAVYDKDGVLDKVELNDGERTRLIYIWFKNINRSKSVVLKYVKEQADRMSKEILGRKQTLARLFFGKFYDGEAVEIAVKTATAEEVQAVIDKYGEESSADNSGNYPVEKMITLEYEPLAVMLMCTSNIFQTMLFGLAADAVEERIKKKVLDKIDKTDDFKFISEEYD